MEMTEHLRIQTTRFGDIEVPGDHVFYFPNGIPGFEDVTKFVIIQAGEDVPFYYLQAAEVSELAFVLTDPFVFYPDYAFDLPDSITQALALEKPEQVKVWSIVTVQDALEQATMNLLAPIVINQASRQGRQVVLHHTSFSTKHKLFPSQGEPAKE